MYDGNKIQFYKLFKLQNVNTEKWRRVEFSLCYCLKYYRLAIVGVWDIRESNESARSSSVFFSHMIQRWYMLLSPASCTFLLTFEMYLISISASEVRCEHCFLRRATYIFIPMKSPINYVSYAAFLIILFKSVFHILYFETFVVVIEFDSATMERCYVVTCILICTFADTFLCLLYFYRRKYAKLK